MTDKFFDHTQHGGVGRQPITNIGRVAYNFRVDQDDIEQRKRRGAAGSMWPTVSLEDKNFWILPRDICLAKKQRQKRKQTDGMMTVFSVLNGFRSDGMTHRQLVESLTFGGIAGGQGAKFDTTGNEPRHPEFVGIVGGLYTIVNNGPERITNGQNVYWDIPEPNTESGPLGRRTATRITAITRPYVPSKQAVTARAVRDAINNSFTATVTGAADASAASVTDQAAMRFKWAALQISVNALSAMLESGLVQYDAAVLGPDGEDARQRNAAAWQRVGKSERETFLAGVAAGIGCRRMQADSKDLIQMPRKNKTVKQHICNLLTFEKSAMLCDYTDGEALPPGPKGELARNQESAIKDILVAVEQANHFVVDRVFCKALTPAAPGKEFVGIFAHYGR